MRQQMVAKESDFIEQRELATTPDAALANSAGAAGSSMSADDDFDDNPGTSDVTGGEIGDGFSGFKRIKKGDLCELR